MPIDSTAWIVCIAAIFISGLIRGFSGFGFALAATPLLSTMISPAQATPIVLMLQIGASLVGFPETVKDFDRRSVLILGSAALVAAPAGTALLVICDAQTARIIIALLTLISAVTLYAGLRFANRLGIARTVPFGLVAGLFSGLCAMPSPPVVLYYMASPVSNAVARASMIALFLITGLGSLVSATHAGLVTVDTVRVTLTSVPAMVLGTCIGSRLFAKYHSRFYKAISLATLVAIAAVSGIRALI